jgi:hypothetical protein
MGAFRDFVAGLLEIEGAAVEPVEPDGLEVLAPASLSEIMGWPEQTRLGWRRPAITLRAMALRQVGTRSPTACNASGRTIRGAERILGQTAVSIHALERCERLCHIAK